MTSSLFRKSFNISYIFCHESTSVCALLNPLFLYLDLESAGGGLKTGPLVKHHTWQKKEERFVVNDKN